MQFTFNMGGGETATQKLAEMCKQHYQCENCPVLEKGAIVIDNTPVSCSTAIIRNIQKNNGKV
jgi:hypothetical protein